MTPDLADLTLFASVARYRSFRRAAVELRLSTSSLSERVRALEERLGVRLLNRTTRSVSLTAAGESLLAGLTPALSEIDTAVERARALSDTPSGTLRINAPTPGVRLTLAPLLIDFMAAHPRIKVELVVDNSLIDIVAAGFDAGVRYGEHLARDMIAVPLGAPQRFALVAAPSFLATHGTPRKPDDLIGAPCIQHQFLGGARPDWEFERDGTVTHFRPDARLVCTDIETKIDAAIAGLGFLSTFEGFVRAPVEDGRLVEVLRDWQQEFPGPFLYYASRRQIPAGLKAFLEFLRARR
ncbi:LysR family transcriptional regulator [Roseiterribacter gracilis]|uniref:LysR family transcriptional regulator n=1 Tax=Roseiterribacter gracilis TaxID=2812848 RepID=A0A8S8XA77_9PROT|nr:LysR family transcriptional regulator [Rhodospirillales bacterium TMPK1]